jgi:hypothetical protein
VEQPVNEADFWLRLEYRVSREFGGMQENHRRFWWCDGFDPQQYFLDDATPRITGRACLCNGPREDDWEFTLFLAEPVGSQEQIDWASLLPPDNVTRWLAVDERRKCIQIEPSAAVPDPG